MWTDNTKTPTSSKEACLPVDANAHAFVHSVRAFEIVEWTSIDKNDYYFIQKSSKIITSDDDHRMERFFGHFLFPNPKHV